MKLIVVFLCLFFSSQLKSHQDENLKFDFGLWSHHFHVEDGKKFNETHNLIGFEYQHMYIATFENSDFKRSIAVGMYSEELCFWKLCGDLLGGVVTGYKYALTPYIAPRIKFEITENVNAQILYYPTKEQVVAIGFQMEF